MFCLREHYLHHFHSVFSILFQNQGLVFRQVCYLLCSIPRKQWMDCGRGLLSYLIEISNICNNYSCFCKVCTRLVELLCPELNQKFRSQMKCCSLSLIWNSTYRKLVLYIIRCWTVFNTIFCLSDAEALKARCSHITATKVNRQFIILVL
jgi:hypothetical protein